MCAAMLFLLRSKTGCRPMILLGIYDTSQIAALNAAMFVVFSAISVALRCCDVSPYGGRQDRSAAHRGA
jgi:hypothetical protein